ncbi:hypothetical protein ABK040_016475 [Willaertia magna]
MRQEGSAGGRSILSEDKNPLFSSSTLSSEIPNNNNNTEVHNVNNNNPKHLESEQFLKKFHIPFYLNEVLSELIHLKVEDPLQYISNYFKSVVNGTNIIHKPYAYIHSTPRNRLSFVDYFEQIYSKISNEQKMNFYEYFQLVLLLCEDFPIPIISVIYKSITISTTLSKKTKEEVERIVTEDDYHSFELPTFQSFIIGFKTYLFFFEFFEMTFQSVFSDDYFQYESISNVLGKLKTVLLASSKVNERNNSYCVPQFEKIDKILYSQVKGSGQVNQSNITINFSEFCNYLYSYVLNVCGGNVVSLLDVESSPISAKNAELQKSRLRKEILYFYNNSGNGTIN